MSGRLRVLLHAEEPVRREGLATMLQAVGHLIVQDSPDVVLCDNERNTVVPGEAEAPVVATSADLD